MSTMSFVSHQRDAPCCNGERDQRQNEYGICLKFLSFTLSLDNNP